MLNEVKLTFPEIADGENKSSPLANTLRNNYRHLRKWAKRSCTNCFRLYDSYASLYPLAIDYYDGRFCVHYLSKTRHSEEPSPQLIEEVEKGLSLVFGVDKSSIYWRTRAKDKETRQYEKKGEAKEFFPVYEYGVKFWVNLHDYLDTGLFLDHRETRRRVASLAKGKRLLNLFAYTCSFSVHAAAAGAEFTKSVDLSNTYTSWGRENFLLNNLSLHNNPLVRADCLTYLKEEIAAGEKYDLIVIDPPTISRSKKMQQLFDIQQDYTSLISQALQLLRPEGTIFFSTNFRKFNFDATSFEGCSVFNISHQTQPLDFQDPKVHQCWKITRQGITCPR